MDVVPLRVVASRDRGEAQTHVVHLTLGRLCVGAGGADAQIERAGPRDRLTDLNVLVQTLTRTTGGIRRHQVADHWIVERAGRFDFCASRVRRRTHRGDARIALQHFAYQRLGTQRWSRPLSSNRVDVGPWFMRAGRAIPVALAWARHGGPFGVIDGKHVAGMQRRRRQQRRAQP